MMHRTLLATAMLGAVAGAAAQPADARIVCNESFQVVQGQEIATPYCQDNYLAQVARQYGIRVSDVTVRQNPNRKREICALIGHDIRVQDTCASVIGRGRRGF